MALETCNINDLLVDPSLVEMIRMGVEVVVEELPCTPGLDKYCLRSLSRDLGQYFDALGKAGALRGKSYDLPGVYDSLEGVYRHLTIEDGEVCEDGTGVVPFGIVQSRYEFGWQVDQVVIYHSYQRWYAVMALLEVIGLRPGPTNVVREDAAGLLSALLSRTPMRGLGLKYLTQIS